MWPKVAKATTAGCGQRCVSPSCGEDVATSTALPSTLKKTIPVCFRSTAAPEHVLAKQRGFVLGAAMLT
jgi:hypothetical protein